MSLETPTDSPNASSAPDWAAEEREILCPLCDYNLKMLTEPRCPECGHRFEWAELLASGGVHPYLYEHHRGDRIRSWIRTFIASRFPWSFWRQLRPTHQVRMGRLYVYAMMTALLTALLAVPGIAISAHDAIQAQQLARAQLLKMWSHPRAATQPNSPVKRFGSAQAAVDAMFPELSFVGAVRQVLDRRMNQFSWTQSFFIDSIIRMLCWPILTMLSVLIFRVSFRQAGIRFGHVLRTVVYSADTMILGAVALAAGEYFTVFGSSFWTQHYLVVFNYFAIPYFSIALLAIVLIRLLLASTLYLRIRGGVAMVIASQIIVWLALSQISLMLEGH